MVAAPHTGRGGQISDRELGGETDGEDFIRLGVAAATVLARLAYLRERTGLAPAGVLVTPVPASRGRTVGTGVVAARGRAANG